MGLRPYQEQLINDVRSAVAKGNRRVLIQLETGGGKTRVASEIILRSVAKKWKILFIVHRKELLDQAKRTIEGMGVGCGSVGAGEMYDASMNVHVGMVQTIVKRNIPEHDLIFADEAHRIMAPSWLSVIEKHKKALVLGLTATPIRLDGKGLGDVFQTMVNGPNYEELVAMGHLSGYRCFHNPLDLSKLRRRGGEFTKESIDELLDGVGTIWGDAVEQYQKNIPGKKALIFCHSVDASKNVAAEFRKHGILAGHIDGSTPKAVRDKAIEMFKSGDLKILSNVDIATEGFDTPDCDGVLILRPTDSVGLHRQIIGRALRPSEGKTAIIIDLVGNCKRHGLPDWPMEWSLETKKRKKGESSTIKVKNCPKCKAANPPARKICMVCEEVIETKERLGPATGDGDIREMTKEEREALLKIKKQKMANERASAASVEALEELGRIRGYRNPRKWALNVRNGRILKNAKSIWKDYVSMTPVRETRGRVEKKGQNLVVYVKTDTGSAKFIVTGDLMKPVFTRI